MSLFRRCLLFLSLSVSISLLGFSAGLFTDVEKSYEYNRCLFSNATGREIIGGSLSYSSYEEYDQVIDVWKDSFEIPLFRNCKSVFDTNDSISFVETSAYELDPKYNSFKVYLHAGTSWHALDDNKIFISSEFYYLKFGNRNYNEAVGKHINISTFDFIIGGVFFVNHDPNAKKIISDYIYEEIGEFAFVGEEFFTNNSPSKTLITFETNNKEIGNVYLNAISYFSKYGLQYSLFNNSSFSQNICNKISLLDSFYSSSYKIILSILLNICFIALITFSFYLLCESKIRSIWLLFFTIIIPCLFVLLFRNLNFKGYLYFLNKTSILYIVFFMVLFSVIPVATFLKDKNKQIDLFNRCYYEQIDI